MKLKTKMTILAFVLYVFYVLNNAANRCLFITHHWKYRKYIHFSVYGFDKGNVLIYVTGFYIFILFFNGEGGEVFCEETIILHLQRRCFDAVKR